MVPQFRSLRFVSRSPKISQKFLYRQQVFHFLTSLLKRAAFDLDEVVWSSSTRYALGRMVALLKSLGIWSMTMNLREAVHVGELRTMPQGHPDYRSIIQEMWRKIGEVHPTLAEYAKFIDWKTYRLGRLQSEMRSEYKKSAFELP